MIGCTIFHHLYWPIKRKERNRGDQISLGIGGINKIINNKSINQISRHFLDQSEETKNWLPAHTLSRARNVLNVFASSFDWLIELRASVIDWYNYVVLVFQITTNNWDEVEPNLEIYF